ncbi:MAG TPA: hypothetical protein VEU27_09820 [Gemmatimonadales bacterium]|nr:hypothetical protein [Gemmatimonadales bacterium]
MTMPTLAAFIAEPARQRGLQPRDDIREPGWTFWELRTLNRHRVVGLVTEQRQFKDAGDLEAEIRGVVSRHFKCAWWRGMAYGVVADVPTISLQPDDLKVLVDVRENPNGTLQWVVLAAGDAHAAVGVHTWMESYLSPVYRSVLQSLTAAGYRVATAVRQKDGLMRFLTAVADLDLALHGFGPRRAFPEFRSDLQPPNG